MMFTAPSSLLALTLSVASTVRAADNAFSVSTLDFKNRFQESGIVPEVIAALDPSVSFYASYKKVTGEDELLVPGSTLTISEAQQPFEFSVENLNNATNITTQTRYLVYLLDADAPARDNPSARNLRHYLAGNYSLSALSSGVLPTARRLFIPSAQFRPFTPFTEPSPQPNTGIHRFIYALYTQPTRFNNAGFESVGMESVIENWNLSQWRTQLGLGPAIGATFFTIDTNANGGQGNSQAGQVVGAGVTGASAALEIPAFMASLISVASVLGYLAFF